MGDFPMFRAGSRGGGLSPGLFAVNCYGIIFRMAKTQKITTHVPAELLRKARRATGKGITETVRLGLGMVASSRAAAELRRLRGKVRLKIDLEELRRDRR